MFMIQNHHMFCYGTCNKHNLKKYIVRKYILTYKCHDQCAIFKVWDMTSRQYILLLFMVLHWQGSEKPRKLKRLLAEQFEGWLWGCIGCGVRNVYAQMLCARLFLAWRHSSVIREAFLKSFLAVILILEGLHCSLERAFPVYRKLVSGSEARPFTPKRCHFKTRVNPAFLIFPSCERLCNCSAM